MSTQQLTPRLTAAGSGIGRVSGFELTSPGQPGTANVEAALERNRAFAAAGGHHRVEIRPALKIEQLFETAVALAEQGRTMMKGIPKPLDLALFTREFEHEVQAAFPPRWLQRLALAPLAWLATHRGYATRYAPVNRHTRMTIPRGFIVGTLAAVALVWGLFAIDPGRSLVSSGVQTAVLGRFGYDVLPSSGKLDKVNRPTHRKICQAKHN